MVCERIGVAKAASTVEYAFLEHCLREDLNETAQRVMAVIRLGTGASRKSSASTYSSREKEMVRVPSSGRLGLFSKGAPIHWVDAATAVDAECRLYGNLFTDPAPDAADKDFLDCLNPDSLEVVTGCKLEAGLKDAAPGDRFQFMRSPGHRWQKSPRYCRFRPSYSLCR